MAMLVVMARCDTTLQADTEQYVLLGDGDKYRSKATIQILDFLPMPKRYVLCTPLTKTRSASTGFRRAP